MKVFYKIGFNFTMGVSLAVAYILLCGLLVVILLNICGCIKTDDSDIDKWNRSGLRIYTDNKTGVQYLRAGNALTPRLDADGKLIVEEVK